MSPNDARHQSLRPCYRTRGRRGLLTPKQTKILSVCYGEKRRYELLSIWVPKSKPRLRLFAFKSGSPEQTKTMSVCYGEKRRHKSSNDDATSSVFTTLLLNEMLPNATSELQCISICHSRDIVCDEHKLLVCVTWSRVSLFACFVPVVF